MFFSEPALGRNGDAKGARSACKAEFATGILRASRNYSAYIARNLRKNMKRVFWVVCLASLTLTPFVCHAENWSHWRGPDFNGSSPEKNLPDNFSKTENVKWSVALPGTS